jgi:hypothetical protein
LLLRRHRTCKGVTKALLGHRIKALLLLGHLVKATKTAEATLLLLLGQDGTDAIAQIQASLFTE